MKKIFLILSILFLVSCEKEEKPYYPVPQEMKNYFSAREGSYWIYNNEITGETDSTFILSYSRYDDDWTYSDKKREVILMNFSGKYLMRFEMAYTERDFKANVLDVYSSESEGGVAYVYDWPPLTNHDIGTTQTFTSERISVDSVNSVTYRDVIYSRLNTVVSGTNKGPVYLTREIWFARNTGIIRFYENTGSQEIRLTLLRKNVIR